MKNVVFLGTLCVAILFTATQANADGGLFRNRGCSNCSASQAWHGSHYYLPYGQPTALVVPPNSVMQTNYSWGVSRNTMTPITAQYGLQGSPSAGGMFYATPRWPTHTNQFGVYPVRAPW